MAEQKAVLELLIRADDWDRAVAVLKYRLRIGQKQKTNHREIDGLFMVKIEIDEKELTKSFYDTIKESDEIAIIADSFSAKNAGEVTDKIYEIETQLRRLLLHVSDIVEAFIVIIGDNAKLRSNFYER